MRSLVALPLVALPLVAAAAWMPHLPAKPWRRTWRVLSASMVGDGTPPPPAPTRGQEEWGTWAHDDHTVTLEMFLDENVNVKRLCVEIVEGFLLVGEDSEDGPPPMLFGRLLQSCAADDLMWAVDEADDDRRVLCIELPKLGRARPGTVGASADCIFDETL